MSLVAKKAALALEFDIPPELSVMQTPMTAAEVLGVVPATVGNLSQLADQLVELVGCTVGAPTAPRAAATPEAAPLPADQSLPSKAAVKEANGDKRRKMNGDVINFLVYYEIDDNISQHVLTLEKYGGEDVGAWVLLAALDQVHQERSGASGGEEATE